MPVTVTASSACYQLGPELHNIGRARDQARRALGDWVLTSMPTWPSWS